MELEKLKELHCTIKGSYYSYESIANNKAIMHEGRTIKEKLFTQAYYNKLRYYKRILLQKYSKQIAATTKINYESIQIKFIVIDKMPNNKDFPALFIEIQYKYDDDNTD